MSSSARSTSTPTSGFGSASMETVNSGVKRKCNCRSARRGRVHATPFKRAKHAAH
ncbi:hypothetical protein COEREDRAFT_83624 [Coemansia reversa NRRL 1564]|uniref:Uncharacterized protein n=1 Tax=Coemansia reversa (strain ATCC 12441 / NRRL 1564) TaxID=763665 RepID=A0A2G5B2I3_COERN|nr:hypothetical protein COEREDRAFT_83624 [Coemansia reversa NRRL 1564]|eukprot:PIA13205.1 hypothetical protein COEREDRAFT_83624 [Coemansia reversa NRRL 1564]